MMNSVWLKLVAESFTVIRIVNVIDGPTAIATSPNPEVNEGDTVTLDGSGSSAGVTYSWAKTSGPGAPGTPTLLPSSTVEQPTFEAPDVDDGETKVFEFTLTVRDANGNYDVDTVIITVNALP